MNGKRHYFYLVISIANTSVLLVNSSLFLTGLIINANSGNAGAIITFSVLLSLSLLLGIVYLTFDGWAYWRVEQGKITVYQLFRRPKSVLVTRIRSVNEDLLKTVFIGTVETMACYEISSLGTIIKIPKENASESLVNEIKRL